MDLMLLGLCIAIYAHAADMIARNIIVGNWITSKKLLDEFNIFIITELIVKLLGTLFLDNPFPSNYICS